MNTTKENIMKNRIVPALSPALVAMLALTACTPQALVESGNDYPEADAVEEVVEEAPAAPEPVEEEPASWQGETRDNPFPYDDVAMLVENETDSWQVSVSSPRNGDDAIRDANMFNDPASEGNEYILVDVTLTLLTEGPVDPWLDFTNGIDWQYVTSEGRTFEEEFVVLPDDLTPYSDVGEMYQDATATATLVFERPAGDAGTIRLDWGGFNAFWGQV